MPAAALALALGLILAPAAAADDAECPQGTERVMTGDPYNPFRCAEKKRHPRSLLNLIGPAASTAAPHCPLGAHPVMTPGMLRPYRCVMGKARSAEPAPGDADDAPVLVPTEGKSTGRRKSDMSRLTAKSYGRFSVPGEIAFEYPKAWHITDGWKDSPPAIYIVFDAGRGGKPVSLTVTLAEPGGPGYQNMDLAMLKEREWQDAVLEPGRVKVDGKPTRLLAVKGSSRSAYVDAGGGRYFTLNYSAPGDLYEAYQPAFERLLRTFRAAAR